MDGLLIYNGKSYIKLMIWGENPTILGNTHIFMASHPTPFKGTVPLPPKNKDLLY